jgi:hypothetical protein
MVQSAYLDQSHRLPFGLWRLNFLRRLKIVIKFGGGRLATQKFGGFSAVGKITAGGGRRRRLRSLTFSSRKQPFLLKLFKTYIRVPDKMADIIVNEVLCFISTHFGSVPNNNIGSLVGNFYAEDDLLKVYGSLCSQGFLS